MPGVYGLLGANGAGKTTLMRMICGVLKPTSGRISLNGKAVEQLGERYYTHLGYMPQDFGFYPDFTAREFMLYMAAVKGLDPKERVRFRNLISDFAKEKIVILSTHIVSDVSYIADTILMMKQGRFLMQEPMSTVTDSIKGKVWELLVDERTAAEYSRKFTVVNLHHENDMVRLRMIEETAPREDAQIVEPSLEDLFLYHFTEETGGEIVCW